MTQRESGYYWVRFEDEKEWRVAHYNSKAKAYYAWRIVGSDYLFEEEEFAEIGDKIERENKNDQNNANS